MAKMPWVRFPSSPPQHFAVLSKPFSLFQIMKEDDFSNDPEWEHVAIQFMRMLEDKLRKIPKTEKQTSQYTMKINSQSEN